MVRKKLEWKNPIQMGELVSEILKSDREAIIVVDGFKGEGKSCLMHKCSKEISKRVGTPYSFDSMTWKRDELLSWINEGAAQKPEMSVVIADEIISMFYAREWFDSGQVDAIKLLNMCRDRHLAVFGAVPNFWELDKNFRSQVRYWIHVSRRGLAWLFEQTENPAAADKWCQVEISKSWAKGGNPHRAQNFVCGIQWDDWETWEKVEYLKIRNKKRVGVEDQRTKPERYTKIKGQRNVLIKVMVNDLKYRHSQVAKLVGLAQSTVTEVCNGKL